MLYIYHKLLNNSKSGIVTWCKLLKKNIKFINREYDENNIILTDDLKKIPYNESLIINHLDILEIIKYKYKFEKLYLVIHNEDESFINIINKNLSLIYKIISIFPLDHIMNFNINCNIDKFIYLPNIDFNKNIDTSEVTISISDEKNLIENAKSVNENINDDISIFTYYGRIDYEKNIILLIDLMRYYYTFKKLNIYYPYNTPNYLILFYKSYIIKNNVNNVILLDETNHDINKNLIYLSAGTMEGLPFTYLELLVKNKIIISYSSGIINKLLSEEFIIDYKIFNEEYNNLKLKLNIGKQILKTGSFIIYKNNIITTYDSSNEIIKLKYLEHLDIWIFKINNILKNIEKSKKSLSNDYLMWYNHCLKKWIDEINKLISF